MPNFSGIWTVTQQMQAIGQSLWPAPPGAPTIGTATSASATSISVTFTAPSSTGYPSSLTYTATSSPGGFTASGSSSPLTVTGLTTGTSYTFTVTATNATGTGPASAASNSVAPAATAPNAPTIGTATATGATTATVSYTAPADNGGSVITSYTATSSPGGITGTLSQAGSGTITVTGLTGNTSYTFTVTATNAVGTSAASASSNSITTPYAIGQAYAGGFYAGQISTSGNGVANFNLVIGPKASAENSSRKFKNANTVDYGIFSVINGPSNSASIDDSAHQAAQFCEGLSIGGYSDWYMPAVNELEVCYYNLKPTTTSNNTSFGANDNSVPKRTSNYTAGTPAQTSATSFQNTNSEAFNYTDFDGFYWSSTGAASYGDARYIRFLDGASSSIGKNDYRRVRAIRRVAV
jgi:hypothetical protein